MKRRRQVWTLALTMLAMPVAAAPVSVGVATFNMDWAGSAADFQAHAGICQSVGWCDAEPRLEKGAAVATAAALALAGKCAAAIESKAGGALQALQVAPCGAYRTGNPVQYETLGNYGDKLAGLQATVSGLIEKDGVQVLAFQGVKSEAVVRAALGQYGATYDTCAALNAAFQTVALAWDRTLSPVPGVCAVRTEMSIKEDPGAEAAIPATTPGLSLMLVINGAPVTFMTLDLHAGCANLKASGPGADAGRTLDDPAPDCRILNRQVADLEDWIDGIAQRSPRLVLMGDFNRRIDEEAAAGVAPGQVRADGSDPAGPNKRARDGYVASRYMWQEIADGKPMLYQLPLSTLEPACRGYAGLDHIVISGAVHALQGAATLVSRKVGVARAPSQPIDTSGHCPRVARLML